MLSPLRSCLISTYSYIHLPRLFPAPGVPDQGNCLQGASVCAYEHNHPSNVYVQGELAVPPALHGEDVAFYFPSSVSIVFNNPAFISSFAESFEAIVMSLNPNAHPEFSDVTPHWAAWSPGKTTEMVFNVTSAGQPVIQPSTTAADLLQRCK
jgi:hypothetical protein